MNRIASPFLISIAALAACQINLAAQTVKITDPAPGATVASATPSTNWFVNLYNDGRAFLTDNTNLFNSGAVLVEVGPVLNLSDLKWARGILLAR